MKYFYDTEFYENGSTIELISIGIVADDGREYYAVNADMPVDRIKDRKWLMENVWPHLPLFGYKKSNGYVGSASNGSLDMTSTLIKPKWVIRNEIHEFLSGGTRPKPSAGGKPELWAYYGAYDHVLLAQMWGQMINLPKNIPMITHDIMTLSLATGIDMLPTQPAAAHNALADARHVKTMYEHIQNEANERGPK